MPKRYVRNTPTERRCPDCEGAGETEVRLDVDDYQATRCTTCTGDGWLRWAPIDALAFVAAERRGVLVLRRSQKNQLIRSAESYYARAKRKAFARVPLPADRVPQAWRIAA